MKNLAFILIIILTGCEALPKISRLENFQGGLYAIRVKELKELIQFNESYSPHEVSEVVIKDSNLRALDNSMNTWKIKNFYLERNQFPNRELVFPAISSLEELYIWEESMKTIRFSSELSQLRYLNITSCSNLITVPNVDKLPSLEVLEINDGDGVDSNLQSIGPGEPNFNVKKVRLYGPFSDMENVSRFPNVEWLALQKTKITSIRGLDSLKKLIFLNFSDNPQLSDVKGISVATNLTQVQFENSNWKPGFSDSFSGLTKLEILNLENCNITSLEWLGKMPKSLVFLPLANNKIKHISNLESLPNVRWSLDTFINNPIETISKYSFDFIASQGYDIVREPGPYSTESTFKKEIEAGRIRVVD